MKTQTTDNEKAALKATLNKNGAKKRSDKKSAFKYSAEQKRTMNKARKLMEKVIGPAAPENTVKLSMCNVVYVGPSIVPSVATMTDNKDSALGSDNQVHVGYHSYRPHPKCPKCENRIYTDAMGRVGVCRTCGTKIVKNPGMSKWCVAE